MFYRENLSLFLRLKDISEREEIPDERGLGLAEHKFKNVENKLFSSVRGPVRAEKCEKRQMEYAGHSRVHAILPENTIRSGNFLRGMKKKNRENNNRRRFDEWLS